jgi:ribosome-binding protein aMBF1 (putative translation factor)
MVLLVMVLLVMVPLRLRLRLFPRYTKYEIMVPAVTERRHPTVFPGFREMAERRHSVSGQLMTLRRELGLSQAEVASRMGTSQSAVARFEAGDLDVRLSTVERYTSALGARLEWRIEHG